MELPQIGILYDDRDLIAVNKPEGIASIAESNPELDSIHSMLENKLKTRLLIVHRLDKEVSGVILFAKNARAHRHLNRQFFDRSVEKHYAAVVYGVPEREAGIIKAPIREFGSGRMGIDRAKGKPSETEWRVVKRFDGFALLNLHPSTGRRHQLRVHLYSIGHPILGDSRYGDKNNREGFERLMLHARSIAFNTVSGKRITVEAPLPEIFERFGSGE